jgi:hypothetical protein
MGYQKVRPSWRKHELGACASEGYTLSLAPSYLSLLPGCHKVSSFLLLCL